MAVAKKKEKLSDQAEREKVERVRLGFVYERKEKQKWIAIIIVKVFWLLTKLLRCIISCICLGKSMFNQRNQFWDKGNQCTKEN